MLRANQSLQPYLLLSPVNVIHCYYMLITTLCFSRVVGRIVAANHLHDRDYPVKPGSDRRNAMKPGTKEQAESTLPEMKVMDSKKEGKK
jgi:hypothetical protein